MNASSEKIFWLSAATVLPWAQSIYVIATVMIVLCTSIALLASWAQNKASNILAADSDRQTIELRVELERAKNAARQIDTNLLHEQRLTANERWRLERVERAVLPRSIFVDWNGLVKDLIAGHFRPINIAVPSGPPETREFGYALRAAFSEAGLLKGFFELPFPAEPNFMVNSGGVIMFQVHDEVLSLVNMLWQKHQIGNGARPMFFSALPSNWPRNPFEDDCILVLENISALSPGAGQPGEGLDANDRPTPAP